MGSSNAHKMWQRFASILRLTNSFSNCYLKVNGKGLIWFFLLLLLGIRFTSYHGNFMLRSTDLLALPAVDCDKAYAMQLSLEETLLTNQTVYFQVALLYPFMFHPEIHMLFCILRCCLYECHFCIIIYNNVFIFVILILVI